MQVPPAAEHTSSAGSSRVPGGPAPLSNPHMTEDFARVFELTGNRITGPVATEALRHAGPAGPGIRILDSGAGAGALSIPAAFSGASVLAIDIAPGMVHLLSERLAPFPNAEARVMDGQSLQIQDGSDLAFSIFGVSLFADWRRGLRELQRALRPGGKGCVATWKNPLGGGPFVVMARALRSVFPGQTPPAPIEGFAALSDPARFATEMRAAGFTDVEVKETEGVWQGPAGPAYLTQLHKLHRYMPPYAPLNDDDRRKVDEAILNVIGEYVVDDQVRITSPILIAVGTKGS